MGNVLEQVTVEDYPVIETLKQKMRDAGAMNAMMSGSGPTVFGLFERRSDAIKAKRAILAEGLTRQVFLTNIHRIKEERQNGE